MGKSKSQTIGYKYAMSLLMGIGRTVSELVEIRVGGETAWRGPACSHDDPTGQSFEINEPNLFGGEKKEGGILGPGRILWGHKDQQLPGAVQTSVGTLPAIREMISGSSPMPNLRGVTSIWFDGEVCSMNPYPKEWKFRVRRHAHGWHNDEVWYPIRAIVYLSAPELMQQKRVPPELQQLFASRGGSKSTDAKIVVPGNIKAMNPAHIIYQCITDPVWGRGESKDLLNENSFIYSANVFCAEGMGLCLNWSREDDIDAFIQTVLDHAGAVLYTDRSTGLITLRPIRADYVIDDLPTFEPGRGLLAVMNDDTGSNDVAFNEVVVKFRDPIEDVDQEARAHNPGARMSIGATNSTVKEYPGLPTKELAARVAARDLKAESAGLKRYKVRLDRSGWRIAPGMPFRIKCPERGIGSIVLRAGEIIDTSSQEGGEIVVSAVEDVFSLPATSMVVPEDPTWTSPSKAPIAPDASLAFEMSYYDLAVHLNQLALPSISDDDAYFAMVSSQPSPVQQQYDLMVDGVNAGTFSFTGNAQLAEPVGPFDTVFKVKNVEYWPEDVIGDSMIVGGERVRIDGWDPATSTITVARGTVDTLPMAHDADTFVWLPDDDLSSDQVVYAPGEEITAAAATRTANGLLTEEDWDTVSVEIVGRVGRPYPPVGVEVDGESIYTVAGQHAEPVLTWNTRNRITQQDQLVGYLEPSVAPEPGTSWEVIVKSLSGEALSTHAVAEGTLTFTYDAAMRAADGAPNAVRFDVKAVRGDMRSLAAYDLPVTLAGGYGLGYGLNYGGA